jgi:PhnB protein
MDFDPYLFFTGDCEEALTAYASIFDGKVVRISRYKDAPPNSFGDGSQPDGDFLEKVMHARFETPSFSFMASDARPGSTFGNSRISLAVGVQSKNEAQRIFDALADGGSVEMPFQPAFWGGYFGMVTDRFGVDWMINAAPDQ